MWYEKIKGYYEKGLWNEKRVQDTVGKVLTQEQANEILGV